MNCIEITTANFVCVQISSDIQKLAGMG